METLNHIPDFHLIGLWGPSGDAGHPVSAGSGVGIGIQQTFNDNVPGVLLLQEEKDFCSTPASYPDIKSTIW